MKVKLIVALVLAIVVSMPSLSMGGENTHFFDCTECHLSGGTLNELAGGNVCLRCHTGSGITTTLNAGSRYNPTATYNTASTANFDKGDASDSFGNNYNTATTETSHHWALPTTVNAAAGSAEPNRSLYPNMFSKYNVSTGKVTCTRCHDPHGDFETNPKLLRLSSDNSTPMTENDLCVACHSPFSGGVADRTNHGLATHPIVSAAEIATFVSSDPRYDMGSVDNYNAATPYTNSAVLVDGGVSCMSCHGPHFTDSIKSTDDGPALGSTGDGLLLRSDGPTSGEGGVRNETAQLRSNLCQDCHVYQLHGTNAAQTGCMDCHGGHSYNGGTPSQYVLSDVSPGTVPLRLNAATIPDSLGPVNYPVFDGGPRTIFTWADNVDGTATGFCEVCHGDVNDANTGGLASGQQGHIVDAVQECEECHLHSDVAQSFAIDADAASCGACHGFPPYKNIAGNRAALYDANDGGYAYNVDDGPLDWNYFDDANDGSSYFKNEAESAHKTHAGRALLTTGDVPLPGAERWYFVGTGGIQNCQPCHGVDAGKKPLHRQDPTVETETFRDVYFNDIASIPGSGYSAAYDAANADCDNVYCHSVGAPRTGDDTVTVTRNYSLGMSAPNTPVWVGNNGIDGYNSIIVAADRCSHCHGNEGPSGNNTMSPVVSGGMGNSPAHIVHIEPPYNYACGDCHENTAIDSTTLSANGTNQKETAGGYGLHVNGVQDVVFNSTVLYNALAIDKNNYNYITGTCSVYCHDPSNTGLSADWDVAGPLDCDSCHGGLRTDGTPITSKSHRRHVVDATGPQLLCADCHGTNSDAGTHAGHVDGIVDMTSPTICDDCHGYDAEDGEVQPQWDFPATTDCATCHAGSACGTDFLNGKGPMFLQYARQGGHNRLAAGYNAVVNYPQSSNPPADTQCDGCHVTDSPNHFDGNTWDNGSGNVADLMLRVGSDQSYGFDFTYTGNEDAYCNNCHTSLGHPTNNASPATRGMSTHQGKKCVACHNVHGGQNIQMIWRDPVAQNQHDPSGTGQYGVSNVLFYNSTVFPAGDNTDSYDEDDADDGGISEDNADDICAVCHTTALGHNRYDGSDNQAPTGHNIGTDCFLSCHTPHNDATESFIVAAGDSCDDCHGYPPSLARSSSAASVGAHGDGSNLHTRVGATVDADKVNEDLTDCAYCHTGADQYTYSLSDDLAAGGARANHGAGDSTQLATLVASIGYNATNASCFNGGFSNTPCHASSAGDGYWTDTEFAGNVGNGLNCDACHFYSASVSSADTPSGLATVEHDEHFDKNIQCSACHNIETYNPSTFSLSHIGSFDFGSGADANDGAALLDMATTEENESDASADGVERTDMVFNDTDNTCSSTGVAAGCHATGTPDWDDPIPPTSAGCEQCHTDTTTTAYNPTSGLHDNTSAPTVTGESHDGSFDGGSGNCITCHTTTPSVNHIDGAIDASGDITVNVPGGTYTPGSPGNCTTTCHLNNNATWAFDWTKDVYNSTNFKECNGCHGLYSALGDSTGWITGTIHATGGYEDRGASHNDPGTSPYPCNDCHANGASAVYTFSPWGTGEHGDGFLQLNNVAGQTNWTYNATNLTYGCAASCHNDPPAYSFPASTAFTPPTLEPGGDTISASCSGCHGIGGLSGNAIGIWPNEVGGTWNDVSMNTGGSHAAHITALAKVIYNETVLGGIVDNDLLTDNTTRNPSDTSDTKQKKICSFCHGTPADPRDTSGGHGGVGDLPAEVNTMYAMWDTGLLSPDDGNYLQTSAATCSTVDCHFNKTTPAANEWYGPGNGDCAMCHTDDGTGNTHTDHMDAQTNNFGINIVCTDCHGAGTTLSAAPTSGHIDSNFDIGTAGGSSYAFTYDTPIPGSCGTNDCHEDGQGGAPHNAGNANYVWADDGLDNCTTCHNNPNSFAETVNSGTRHSQHMTSGITYTCGDCHTAEDVGTHIDNTTDYGGTSNLNYATAPGCTNDCHIAVTARGDWTDTDPLACTDCHDSAGGSYVGDGANFQVSGLHDNTSAPSVTGESHDNEFYGLAANCESCHTATPSSSHIDGNPIQSGAVINVDLSLYGPGSYTVAPAGNSTGTCTADCHTAGLNWSYQWTTNAYNPIGGADITECDGCHGAPTANSWNAGTIHADVPARGQGAHAATADLTFPCSDCHSIGDNTAAVYDWSAPQWFANNASSSHGDGNLQMNYNTTNFTYNSTTASCAGTGGCHIIENAKYSFPSVSGTTNWTVAPVTGTRPDVSCSGCHGGTNGGGTYLGYWPDNPSDTGNEDTAGAHPVHITIMAEAVWAETISQLLSDSTGINPGVSSDSKQTTLCAYCHVVGDVDHGDAVDLPAETLADEGGGYFQLWNSAQLDSANYDSLLNSATFNCTNVDCHNNRDTNADAADFSWYSGSSSACSMCHDPDNVVNPGVGGGDTHTDHTSSFTNGFGIANIACTDCHGPGTDWAGTPPPLKTKNNSELHLDGTMQSVGSVTFTYVSGTGCGTNDCHTSGYSGDMTPAQTTYAWGTNAGGECAICHLLDPTTTDHTPHIASSYVTDCNDCHTAANVGTHIDTKADFGGTISSPASNSGWDGSCTNTCHLADQAGDWDGTPATVMACVDCHEAGTSYVGDGTYLHTSGLHATTATNVTPHDDSIPLSAGCETCHSAYGSEPSSHMDGNWQGDLNVGSQTEDRFVTLAGFVEGNVNESTCSGSSVNLAGNCHTDNGAWSRLWSTDADSDYTAATGNPATGQAVCNVCHGLYSGITASTGWRTGTTHATSGADKGSSHTDVGTECEDCHAYPTSAGTGHHEDDSITIFGGDGVPSSITLLMGDNGTNPGWYCSSCHDADMSDDALNATSHTYVDSVAFPAAVDYAIGTGPGPEGGCTGCHGNDVSGAYWPDGSKTGTRVPGSAGPADRDGQHTVHVRAIGDKINGGGFNSATMGNKNATCGYCHYNPGGGGGHNDASQPADVLGDGGSGDFLDIWGVADTDGAVNQNGDGDVTCSSLNCHFNNTVTPQWYIDNNPPEATTIIYNATLSATEVGSVAIDWLSPGEDANVDRTTAYVYDMRMANSSAELIDANYNSAVHVGGLPITYLRGEPTEVVVHNLDTTKQYYFRMRTQDSHGNWSPRSNTLGPITPSPDNVAPEFYGADKALAGDEGQAINLYWTAAEDHTMYDMTTLAPRPITYKIWLKAKASGALDMDVDSPYLTGWPDTRIELDSGDGILNDQVYYLGVRACDDFGTCDDNDIVVSVTPHAPPLVDQEFFTYWANNSNAREMIKGGTSGSASAAAALSTSSTSPTIFYGTAQAKDIKYRVSDFALYFASANSPPEVTATVGICNSTGGGWNAQSASITVPLVKKLAKVYKFKLSDVTGVTVPANSSICIGLYATASIDYQYGTTALGGNATISEEFINYPPTAPGTPDNGTTMPVGSAIVDIKWNAFTDTIDGLNDVIHYDVYGATDGSNFDYVIAEELDATKRDITWDTQAAGLFSGSNVSVRVRAGDGYGHTAVDFTNLGTLDTTDYVAPSTITDLVARPRPKTGAVQLKWTTPGDDFWNNGRAEHFDIRYDTRQIVDTGGNGTTTVNFDAIEADPDLRTPTSGSVFGEPVPDFGQHVQSYEVTGLEPGTDYWFAIKTGDELGNMSGLATIASPVEGGPHCGMCHTTGPSVVESEGNHKLHGYTLYDCTKCHGAQSATYHLNHQDNVLTMGYGPLGPQAGIISGSTITYTNNGQPMGSGGDFIMYQDTNGFGGFGDGSYTPVGPDSTDNGGCFNFGAMGIFGCHGSAGSDPDGAGQSKYPTFETPIWLGDANLDCGRCHGNPNRTTDLYGNTYDMTIYYNSVYNTPLTTIPEQIIGAPGVDNRGGWDYNSASVDERMYTGQHDKHLNYSFRFSKGDSCNLCHPGHYEFRDDLDAKHGDGVVDLELDLNAAGPDAHYNSGTAGVVAGSCFDMDPYNCHPSDAEPKWDTLETFACIGCHTMQGSISKIGHFTDPAAVADVDDVAPWYGGQEGNCTWCHFPGHPTDDVGGTALILENSSQVGLEYKSGGIHLRKQPGGVGPVYQTEAELCWGCHDAQSPKVSEWGPDDSPAGIGQANNITAPANGYNYNYGYLSGASSTNWTVATWDSPIFGYKSGKIQSTHAANLIDGISDVTWSATRSQYEEDPDPVANIRCSNCHDVHNMNFARGDNPQNLPALDGPPYLRGTWVGNPYMEDGAPRTSSPTSSYTPENLFGSVPRGGTMYNNDGGFQIDQNNTVGGVGPTAGLGLGNSAGLCTLCHGNEADLLDWADNGAENLWLGTNGHSNSALGGTANATLTANIFSFAQRNPNDTPTMYTDDYTNAGNPMMAYVNVDWDGSATARGDGFRSVYPKYGYADFAPQIDANYAYKVYDWGASIDNTTTDKGYHAFTCSKCHSPHASRLPKLLITNCLDTRHNNWDDDKPTGGISGTPSQGLDTTSVDNDGRTISNVGSAQNCHRLGDATQSGRGGGWNKVSPWTVPKP